MLPRGRWLRAACKRGDLEEVKWLLDAGAEINRANSKGSTPLYLAAAYGRKKVVRLLLEAGAELDRADPCFGGVPGTKPRAAALDAVTVDAVADPVGALTRRIAGPEDLVRRMVDASTPPPARPPPSRPPSRARHGPKRPALPAATIVKTRRRDRAAISARLRDTPHLCHRACQTGWSFFPDDEDGWSTDTA